MFFFNKRVDAQVTSKPMRFVSANSQQMSISGRHEHNVKYIGFSSSGVSITFAVQSSDFSIVVEDCLPRRDSLTNWFEVFVGNSSLGKLVLKPGKHEYPIKIPATIYPSTKPVLIKIVKATESAVGEVRFYGIEIPANDREEDNYEIVTTGQLKIEFIGNSITCGYGNMVSIPDQPVGNPLTGFHPHNENAYQSYAMQTARRLNALPMLVCYSGRGLYRNFDGDTTETLPKIYDRIHLQNKKSKTWDHSKQIPDIIVINLGTNDYYLESQNKPLNDSVFIETYIQFIEKLISYYPNAKIVCANGSMLNDNWPEGKKCWTRIQNNIRVVCDYFHAKGKASTYSFFFAPQQAPFGEDYHPSLATHTRMADDLTEFIKTVVIK